MKICIRIVYLFLILAVSVLTSCVKNNKKPIWLEINSFTLNANVESIQDPGHLSHKFSNAWVYVDEKLIGTFELPCKIPVLAEGNSKSVRIYPAILNNGASGVKKIYPFVEPFELTLDLTPGETYILNPTTRYYKNIQFWIEDFDGGTVKLETDNLFSNTFFNVESDNAISLSNDYAHIHFAGNANQWIGRTTGLLNLAIGQETYMEIDYRISSSVETGLRAVLTDGSTKDNVIAGITTQEVGQETWKKIYVDLKNTISYTVNASGFKQYFKSILPGGQTIADIYIDNIKIVRF